MLSILTPPKHTRLIPLDSVKAKLGISGSAQDASLGDDIDAFTDAAAELRDAMIGRRQVRVAVPGYGDCRLSLPVRPFVRATKITDPDGAELSASELAAVQIEDAEAGFLYRDDGFQSTAAVTLVGDMVAPVPLEAQPLWLVEGWAGYLVPDDNVTGTTISFSGVDDSINDSAGGLPYLQPGEFVVVGGSPANSKTLRVVTATASKITTDEAITTEAAGATITLSVATVPPRWRRAALQQVCRWSKETYTDPGVASVRVADTAIAFRGTGAGERRDLDEDVVEMLGGRGIRIR